MSSSSAPQRLFLVDGTALAYRSHFAFARRPLLNSKGRDVGALFAYTGTLLRILEQETPPLIAVAFDLPEPTFRHAKYKEYKATRDKTPDELVEQLPDIKAVTAGLGITTLEKGGFEADDLIGTLAVQGAAKGCEVLIVGGDKDFMQLVSERVKIYNMTRPESDVVIQGIEEVRAKFGVVPEQVVEVMGLMGDASDNVPGVPGVGPKTASRLIQEHGSIAGLYAALESIKSKAMRTKLADNREQALLSRELVIIDTQVPLGCETDGLIRREQDHELLKEMFLEHEFNRYLSILERKAPPQEDERRYTLVDSWTACEALLQRMQELKIFALDLETTSLNPRDAEIVGLSLAFEEHEAFYIAAHPARLPDQLFTSDESEAGGSLLPRFLIGLQEMLGDPAYAIIGQNLKYDLAVLRRAGLGPVQARVIDTMVAHYLCHPGDLQHGLDFLSLKYLGITKIPTTELIGKGKKQISMADVPVERVCEYACEDVDMTLRLENMLIQEIEDQKLESLFYDLEMPLLLVLEQMEHNGVCIDEKNLAGLAREHLARLERLTEEIHGLAGVEFNINSTQQLGKILFERMEVHKQVGLKRLRKTKRGYSTDAAVLESISEHPIGRLLIEYRQLQKLHSTYVEALPRLVHPSTGYIHTSFNQAVAATGRLSSSDPNLQNIPIRTDEGRRIREAFVPRRPGWRLLSADYSQVELRLLAHISGDENLINAFRRGEDIHRGTASLIFGVPPEEVSPKLRGQAKSINFGIIYGMGPHRLARETGLSFAEAKDFIEAYFLTFPGVKAYIDTTLETARRRKHVTTLLGRRRAIDDILASNQQVRSNAENMAVNTPIQGTAADLIKKAMVEIHHAMVREKLASLMILQVHDELVFDVPQAELEVMKDLVREKMEGALELSIPLVVDLGVGSTWSEAH